MRRDVDMAGVRRRVTTEGLVRSVMGAAACLVLGYYAFVRNEPVPLLRAPAGVTQYVTPATPPPTPRRGRVVGATRPRDAAQQHPGGHHGRRPAPRGPRGRRRPVGSGAGGRVARDRVPPGLPRVAR